MHPSDWNKKPIEMLKRIKNNFMISNLISVNFSVQKMSVIYISNKISN